MLVNAQVSFRYPTYPGCEKKKDNDELKDCFYTKLRYELTDNLGTNLEQYWTDNIDNKKVSLVFTISKEGKVKDYSYTPDSNTNAAVNFLKQINKLSKYYESKGKKFKPAFSNGKPIDYTINLSFTYDGRMLD